MSSSKHKVHLSSIGSISTAIGILFLLLAPNSKAATDGSEKKGQEVKLAIKDLLPNKSRFVRGFKLKTIYLDQPDFKIDAMTGSGEPNKDDHLWKFELSLDISRVLWSTDELVSAYALAADKNTRALVDTTGFDTKYVGSNPLKFFARARSKDWFRRFASGFTFSTGQSERPAPAPLDPLEGLRSVEDFEETYNVVFDPKKMLLTTDRILTAYKGVQHFANAHRTKTGLATRDLATSEFELAGKSLTTKSEFEKGRAIAVLRDLSGISIAKQSLVAAIPSIEFKTVDQFDFASIGGFSRTSPFLEGSIETISITWDLASALNTAKQRRAALQAIALHEKLVEQDRTLDKQLEIIPAEDIVLCASQYVYVPLTAKNAVGKIAWSGNLPDGIVLTTSGVLQGSPASNGSFQITATEAWSTRRTSTKTIAVLACN